jgi:uncharacterized protein (DUF1499 family)
MFLKLVILVILLFIGLIIGALWRSGAPLNGPPGTAERLRTYFTTNIAETASHSRFPELQERHYQIPPDEMLKRVQDTLEGLHWAIVTSDPRSRIVQAVVTTELLGFEDDFTVTIHPRPGGSSRLAIRSASRVGQADFGANIGHILAFFEALEQGLPADTATKP